MDFDFTPYFKRYEALLDLADGLFEQVLQQHPECVNCKIGCSDCCHALFDLTLIEALYLNHKFNERFSGPEKEELFEAANVADRQAARIKRDAYRSLQKGTSETEVLEQLAEERIRCPLLDGKEQCVLYEIRPITCRLYGIPTAIGGRGHTCGISGFEPGKPYPTVHLDKINQQLQQISAELVRDLGSGFIKLVDLLVPLSMALITIYDEAYFGLKEPEEERLPKSRRRRRRSL
jgi:Fe-S-cluster containining protein